MLHLKKYTVLMVALVFNFPSSPGSTCWSKELSPEPSITIRTSNKILQLTRSDLLLKKGSGSLKKGWIHLVVESDPAYEGKKMTYQAVPIYSLFEKLGVTRVAERKSGSIPGDEGEVIQFHSQDGFSATISSERLLNSSPNQSIAYLAIEPERKWPRLPNKSEGETAGPFYIVWSNPNTSHINREEWPYQVTELEIKKSLLQSYPNIFPLAIVEENSPIRKGFRVFTQVCFNCHTMNLEGESHVGPDLNYPMNPTEYFKDGILQNFVRNPKSVRAWPGLIMPSFPPEVVSANDLEALVEYLKHMSTHKVKAASVGEKR